MMHFFHWMIVVRNVFKYCQKNQHQYLGSVFFY